MIFKATNRDNTKIKKEDISINPTIKISMVVGDTEFTVGDIVNLSYIDNDFNKVMKTEENVSYKIRKATGKIIRIGEGEWAWRKYQYIEIDSSENFSQNTLLVGFGDIVSIEKIESLISKTQNSVGFDDTLIHELIIDEIQWGHQNPVKSATALLSIPDTISVPVLINVKTGALADGFDIKQAFEKMFSNLNIEIISTSCN